MSFLGELRYAARSLRATPLFTAASIVILSLGIGATSAVFSVVNGLLLRPLPVREPGHLVRIWMKDVRRGFEHVPLSYPEYERWAERATSFESLAALWSWGAGEGLWTVDGEARRIQIEQVSANFFDILGVEPLYGRSFVPADEHRTVVPPVLLSYEVFRSRFGGDPSVLGRSLPVPYKNFEGFEVIGILPPRFRLSSPVDVYVPTRAIEDDFWKDLGCECDLIGRLRAGVSPREARAELQAIHERDVTDHPTGSGVMEVVVTPLLDTIVGEAGTASLFLFGAVSLLLALATVNLAGLFLTRTAKRQRELAVRAAIGAARSALVRQMVAESLLIALLGLFGGFLLASWGVEVLLKFGGAELPRTEGIEVDAFVLGFTALLAVVATLGFGLWPAIRASRFDLVHSLRGRTAGVVNTRLVGRLVVAEIAIAFVLLMASSLLVRSLLATRSIDPGFRIEGLLSIAIRLPESKYPDVEGRFELLRRLVGEVEALPGVLGVTPTLFRPGGGTSGISGALRFEGQTEDEAREKNAMAQLEWVAPSFFQVMAIPIVRGRAFSERDRLDSEPVAILSEALARAQWPGEDPIGKWAEGFSRRLRIVGVAADTRFRELRRPWQSVYFPVEQNPFHGRPAGSAILVPRTLVVHTEGDPDLTLPSILDRIRSIDPEIPLDDVITFEALMERELARPRFHAFLSSAFSFVGLVLSLTGIYGVIASFVAQRLPELGLRMALGATPERLRGWIVGRGFRISVWGLALGLFLAVPLLRFTESLLYGVSPSDVTSFAAVALVLALASLAATYIPARGASRADPMALLREE